MTGMFGFSCTTSCYANSLLIAFTLLPCSDKQAIDCLKQAGWSVEGGIEVFYSMGMQGTPMVDTRSIEQLYIKYKGEQLSYFSPAECIRTSSGLMN